jgi:hypothetical protein
MIRCFKECLGPSRKQVPPENPTHQATDTNAERGRDSDGEHRSSKISELIRPMGLIRSWHPGIDLGEGSRIVNQDRRVVDQQPLAPNAPTLPTPESEGGDASEFGRLLLVRTDIYSPSRLALQGRGQTQSGSAGTRSENEDPEEPGVQQPTEIAPERAAGGDVHDPAQPGKSRGKFLVFWSYCCPY